MENKNVLGKVIGIGITLLALYGAAYFISKGWQKGQEKTK